MSFLWREHGESKEEMRKRARELLRFVFLAERENRRPLRLSAGGQQRVVIARSLANNPSIVLADEPTGNLDVKTKYEIVRLLGKLNAEQGTTIVMVTHDSVIASHASRVLFLSDGKLLVKERMGLLAKEKLLCPSCGREVQANHAFCPRCGRKL